MRLHRNLVYTTIDALNAIFNEGEYADKVVARSLKKDKRWGSSDRKFVAETIYEIVRWKRLYSEIAEVKEPFDRDNLWRIFAVWAVLRGYPIPDWRQLDGTPERKIKGRFDELSKITIETLSKRQDEIPKAEQIIKVYKEEFNDWLNNRKLVPAINALKESLEAIQKDEINFHKKKFKNFDETQAELLTNRFIQKITTQFVKHLKEEKTSVTDSIQVMSKVFGKS